MARTTDWVLFGLLAFSLTGYAAAAPRRLHVENNGVDSTTCGDARSPCRSISQGIENASPGDTVLVGPGQYGDLDGDGLLASPGEEHGQIGTGCVCIVFVTKQVTLLSTDGAAATHIDSSRIDTPTIPIHIQASNVEVGRPGQGFMVTGSTRYTGIAIFGANTSNVHVAGNIAQGNADGFSVFGHDNLVEHNLVVLGDGPGIEVNGRNQVVRNNVIENADGISVEGTGHQLIENIVTGPGWGFSILSGDAFLLRNEIIGNHAAGIFIYPGANPLIRDNNIYGNGGPFYPNCGIYNNSGRTITASKNYWGASTGPGSDPADGVCNTGGSQVITAPSREFAVAVPNAAHDIL
jgi:parallel beta-helix repeat protein